MQNHQIKNKKEDVGKSVLLFKILITAFGRSKFLLLW